MEVIMKKLKIIFIILALVLMVTSCDNKNSEVVPPSEVETKEDNKGETTPDKEVVKENENVTGFKFVGEDELDKFLNMEKVVSGLKSEPFGATSPFMAYADDNHAAIITHKGILIIDLAEERIINAIDAETKLNRTMGDATTAVLGSEDYIMAYNEGFGVMPDEDFYIYSIKENKLMKSNKEDIKYFNISDYTNEYDEMVRNIIEISDTQEYNSIKVNNNLIVFRSDYNDSDNWNMYILDLEQDGYREFSIFD